MFCCSGVLSFPPNTVFFSSTCTQTWHIFHPSNIWILPFSGLKCHLQHSSPFAHCIEICFVTVLHLSGSMPTVPIVIFVKLNPNISPSQLPLVFFNRSQCNHSKCGKSPHAATHQENIANHIWEADASIEQICKVQHKFLEPDNLTHWHLPGSETTLQKSLKHKENWLCLCKTVSIHPTQSWMNQISQMPPLWPVWPLHHLWTHFPTSPKHFFKTPVMCLWKSQLNQWCQHTKMNILFFPGSKGWFCFSQAAKAERGPRMHCQTSHQLFVLAVQPFAESQKFEMTQHPQFFVFCHKLQCESTKTCFPLTFNHTLICHR